MLRRWRLWAGTASWSAAVGLDSVILGGTAHQNEPIGDTRFDDVRLYGRVLDATEIENLTKREMDVYDEASQPVANGGGPVDIGLTYVDSPVQQTFTIHNVGALPLTLSGAPAVAITGPDAARFRLAVAPETTIEADGGVTSFTIEYDASVQGFHTATVSIANNDADENPYTFSICAEATDLIALAHLPFDETSGSTAYDSVGDHDGTIYGTEGTDFSWTSDAAVGSGALDSEVVGASWYPPGSVNVSLSGVSFDALTVSCWFDLDAIDGWDVLFAIGGPASSYNIKSTNDRFYSYVEGSFSTDSEFEFTEEIPASYAPSGWTHLAITFDQTAKELNFYFNGVLEGTRAWDSAEACDQVLLGDRMDGGSNDPIGDVKFDDLVLYDVALTPTQVYDLLYARALASKATTPSPAHLAEVVDVDADLSWTAGAGATSHDVYFGTTNPPSFQSNQASTTFDPGALQIGQTYYWRVDEHNAIGAREGDLWQFVIGIDRSVVWVDFSSPDGGDGQQATPFDTLAEAIAVVDSGGQVRIEAGASDEALTIDTPMTLQAINGSVRIGASP